MNREWAEMPRHQRLMLIQLYAEQPLEVDKMTDEIKAEMATTLNCNGPVQFTPHKLKNTLTYLRKDRDKFPEEYRLAYKGKPQKPRKRFRCPHCGGSLSEGGGA